jgi:hypothetical protein
MMDTQQAPTAAFESHDTPEVDYENLAVAWHDGQELNPGTRHRRRLMLQLLSKCNFNSVLEVGGGQPYLLRDVKEKYPSVECTGTDLSRALIENNRKEFPQYNFEVLDVVNEALPKKYDVVIASEVLEHVKDYHKSLKNMAEMASKYIIVTVPSSQVFPIDKSIGHYRHYQPEDMTKPLEELGFTIRECYKWGFPFHNIYKHLINKLGSPESMREKFAESSYSGLKSIIPTFIYWLFFLNVKRWGYQLVILAERKEQ